MKTINLRWIYTHYRHDEFVEVSDEVWEAMRQAQREMNKRLRDLFLNRYAGKFSGTVKDTFDRLRANLG